MAIDATVIFGGAFDMVGNHHCRVMVELSNSFEKVVVYPCGPRQDKPGVNLTEPGHRLAMLTLAVQSLHRANIVIEDYDIRHDTFSFTETIDRRFEHKAWHAVGTDLILGGHKNEALIQHWKDGARFWREASFAVITRAGAKINADDLPPHSWIFDLQLKGASSDVKELILAGRPFEQFIPAEVAAYIKQHHLYGYK